MSQKTIRAALESRLKTWADAQVPVIPVAWQNVSYTPVSGTRYIRAYLLPAETFDGAVTGDYKLYAGIFQLSIYSPDGTGTGAAETIAEAIIAQFAQNTAISKSGLTIFIDRTPSMGPSMNDEGWHVLPVSIRYRVDKTT